MKKKYLFLAASVLTLASCGTKATTNPEHKDYLAEMSLKGDMFTESDNYYLRIKEQDTELSANGLMEYSNDYPTKLKIVNAYNYKLANYDDSIADESIHALSNSQNAAGYSAYILGNGTPLMAYTSYDETTTKNTLKIRDVVSGDVLTSVTKDNEDDHYVYFGTIYTLPVEKNTDDEVRVQRIEYTDNQYLYVKYVTTAKDTYSYQTLTKAEYDKLREDSFDNLVSLRSLGFDLDGYQRTIGTSVVLYDQAMKQTATFNVGQYSSWTKVVGKNCVWYVSTLSHYDNASTAKGFDEKTTRAVKFDYKTGKVTITENLNFQINSTKPYYDETGKYIAGSIVRYQKITSEGEVENINLVNTVTDKLEFKGDYYCNLPLNSKVFEISEDSYLVYNGTCYDVTKGTITNNTKISSFTGYNNEGILYLNYEGKYVFDSFTSDTDLVNDYRTLKKINGEYLYADYVRTIDAEKPNTYTVTGNQTINEEYIDYFKQYGFIITDTAIKVIGGSSSVTIPTGYKVKDFSVYKRIGNNEYIYKVIYQNKTLSTDTMVKYFTVEQGLE